MFQLDVLGDYFGDYYEYQQVYCYYCFVVVYLLVGLCWFVVFVVGGIVGDYWCYDLLQWYQVLVVDDGQFDYQCDQWLILCGLQCGQNENCYVYQYGGEGVVVYEFVYGCVFGVGFCIVYQVVFVEVVVDYVVYYVVYCCVLVEVIVKQVVLVGGGVQ